MNQVNVKVSFYLKKSETDVGGNCPVMAKLSIGKYSEAAFSVKMKVSQSRWTSGRASGKSVAAKEINNRLDEIRAMALSIYSELSASALYRLQKIFQNNLLTDCFHQQSSEKEFDLSKYLPSHDLPMY